MPAAVSRNGVRLPASYANFLVINGAVLMPAFRQPRRDREAASVLAACFPGREVVAIDCLELVRGLGTLHCISQQQPATPTMKTTFLLAALCGARLLSGCQSGLSDDMHSVLGPREAPRSQVFQADQRATYAAVRTAALSMGYKFVRGGPAQGEFDALSGISGGDDPGSARQISMKVHLSPAAESGTEVEVSLVEVIEENSANQPGMATQTPLRDTPLYDVFFRNIQMALASPAKAR